jgi:hypothetical protein
VPSASAGASDPVELLAGEGAAGLDDLPHANAVASSAAAAVKYAFLFIAFCSSPTN